MNPGHRLQISPRYINFFPPRRPEGPNKDHLRRRRDPARVRARQAGPRDGRARPARLYEFQVPRQDAPNGPAPRRPRGPPRRAGPPHEGQVQGPVGDILNS